jgi:hypothetical protein
LKVQNYEIRGFSWELGSDQDDSLVQRYGLFPRSKTSNIEYLYVLETSKIEHERIYSNPHDLNRAENPAKTSSSVATFGLSKLNWDSWVEGLAALQIFNVARDSPFFTQTTSNPQTNSDIGNQHSQLLGSDGLIS